MLSKYLEEISRHHVHGAFWGKFCWTHIGECDRFDLIASAEIVNVLVNPRVKCALIFYDTPAINFELYFRLKYIHPTHLFNTKLEAISMNRENSLPSQ